MTCLDELKNALLAVSPHVYHFHAHKPQAPYIVWGEDGPGDTVFANGRLVLQALGGTVDLFTGDPEDTALFEGIQAALDRGCCWGLNSIQYEEDTGLTPYEWRWEMA